MGVSSIGKGAYTMGLVDKIKGLLGQAPEKTRPLLKQDTETAEPPPQQVTGAPPAQALSDAERAADAESAAADENQ